MSELSELSLNRIVWSLPDFAGTNLRDKLENGRAAAEAALRKHLPNFKFDPVEAARVMHTIDAWSERNAAELSAAMKDTSKNDLPGTLHATLGNNKQVADFLVASFTLAAAGLGPWKAYEVQRVVSAGQLSDSWAQTDAQSRLQSFGIIVKLDNDGQLGPLLRGESSTAGLGIPPAVLVAIVIATAILGAYVITYLYLNKRLEINNRLMREICERAYADKRDNVVMACIDATKELQQETLTGQIGSLVTKVALVGAGAYVIGKFVIPALLERKSKTS